MVRALDVDAGPGLNPDEAHDNIGDIVAEAARSAGKENHPAMGEGSYVIWDRRIASEASRPPWSWRDYTGTDAHTSHPHISVTIHQRGYDSTRPWGLLEHKPDSKPKPDPLPPGVLDMDLKDHITIPGTYQSNTNKPDAKGKKAPQEITVEEYLRRTYEWQWIDLYGKA